MTLTWKPATDAYTETHCLRYSVSRARVNGRLVYTAWRQGRPPLHLFQQDATPDTRQQAVDACKAACVAHFAGDSAGRKPGEGGE